MIIRLQHPKRRDHLGLDTKRFYFELQAEGNFETIATSEVYESREAAEHAIDMIVQSGSANTWTVTDATAL